MVRKQCLATLYISSIDTTVLWVEQDLPQTALPFQPPLGNSSPIADFLKDRHASNKVFFVRAMVTLSSAQKELYSLGENGTPSINAGVA
ncbi:hypothetical protein TNCV_114551 [Trichonephila clavipes]|nr:hypothetical protein TNCV_114551 [Trichonephila clavipes]